MRQPSRRGTRLSQSTAYRLRQRMRQGGKLALQEGRHGHPAKLRGEVREWLEQTCRQAPHTPSHEIQEQLVERFALPVSVSQLNRVRAADGASAICPNLRKKSEQFSPRAAVAGGGRSFVVDFLPRTPPACFPSWKEPCR